MLQFIPSTTDAERDIQMQEARRMSAAESAQQPVQPRRTLHAKRTPQARPERAVAAPKGHEAFLKMLESSGATISVEKLDGSVVIGTVKHSDKYTITMRTTFEGKPTERVLFKHDISEFSAITPRPSQG